MDTRALGQRLAIAVALSLTLVIGGTVGLGVAIRQGDLAPPNLNLALGGLHIVAYITDPITCRPYLPCMSPSRDYYVVWVLRKTAPNDVRETGRWILTVPLRR